VAIINADEDIIESLQFLLEDEGYHTVGEHVVNFKKGRADFAALCQQHQPEVIISGYRPAL
jgi:CheY-like chemotaxis protein